MSSAEKALGSAEEEDSSSVHEGAARESAEGTTVPEALRVAVRERDMAEESRDRFSFLAEVSRTLSGSLDYESTLTTVAGMSLPYLDAWCIVDLITKVGGIRRLAVLHPDPDRQGVARELHTRYPPKPGDALGAPRVVRTGRSEMVFDVSDEALEAMSQDDAHLALLRRLGVRSYVIVPMVAREKTWARSPSSPPTRGAASGQSTS